MQTENLTKADVDAMNLLTEEELAEWEDLIKSCPRCGKASANKSNPAGRCRACLNKLKTAKKTPGHWQRSQTKFDDAKRRERGKNGTAHKKTKGLAESRQKFVKKFKSDEKKAGEKLSPDRISNSKGYNSKNVRNVKESLNVGRHHVDPKKLANWRKRLKKAELTEDELLTLVLAKAEELGDKTLSETLRKVIAQMS